MRTATSIQCPKCHYDFEPTAVMSEAIEARLESEYQSKLLRVREELELSTSREITSRVSAAEKSAALKAKQEAWTQLTELREIVQSQKDKLAVAQENELAIRKQKRELEEAKEAFELESTRKLDAARSQIRAEAEAKLAEQHQLKQSEWNQQREGMERLIADLKQRVEQGSTQTQGESLEVSLESILKETFPFDIIEPVGKGISGVDILQRVVSRSGQQVGTIAFEIKRTKSFSPSWLPKLRSDQREAKAEVAVLVSTVLPAEVKQIGFVDGVWVSSIAAFPGLALALRASLLDVAQAKQAQAGRKEKAVEVYDYLNGSEFRGRVQGLVESLVSLREGVETERRGMEKNWSRREKELTRAMVSAAGFYGDLQGFIGDSLQEIPQLSLEGR